MPLKSIRISGTAFGAGVGAGLAAALLSMLTGQMTSFAIALGLVAPLPIMIATLSFGSLAGLIAALVGMVAVGVFDVRPGAIVLTQFDKLDSAGIDVLVFAAGIAIPAWLLARLAAMAIAGVQAPTFPAGSGLAAPARAAAPLLGMSVLGTLLATVAGFAISSVALDFAIAVTKIGSFEAFIAATVKKAEPLVETLMTSKQALPSGLDLHQVAVAVTWAQMPLMAAAEVVLLVFNLWLAARIARASGLLGKTWLDIPNDLHLPRVLAIALAVALGLSFAGGFVGAFGLIVSGALVMSFALQGLAVIHALTRGKTYRLPLLIIVYLSTAMLMPFLMPLLIALYGLLGLLDTAVSFRDRQKPIVVKKS
jgi:hypothetical protein